ncbi:hypothetical protein POF45_06345 [Pseudomonas sp. 681]|uniref:Uncharacterized protein n=1 Tax=Pseudomonas fungipugnans TaxID=3024217 RepID=A0ABT6QJI8_9PSED|nr:hypothetical protein [Pseudomonas sp. 681]MDI2591052.1 hypothetical protein [Pseudomonas sp. 681]
MAATLPSFWMNASMIHSIKIVTFTLCAAICFSHFDAHAQAGDESADRIQIISPAHPVWLVEKPYAESPMLTASTYGDSAYSGYHSKATLEISCHPQNPEAGFRLQIAPQALGFNSGAFEGPDVSARGSMRITTGTRTAVDHKVSGSWTDGGVFQVGTIFSFEAPIPRDELAYWASDASRGQPLQLLLAPKAGGKLLTATFSLPKNNEGLKKVVRRCLSTVAATPVRL